MKTKLVTLGALAVFGLETLLNPCVAKELKINKDVKVVAEYLIKNGVKKEAGRCTFYNSHLFPKCRIEYCDTDNDGVDKGDHMNFYLLNSDGEDRLALDMYGQATGDEYVRNLESDQKQLGVLLKKMVFKINEEKIKKEKEKNMKREYSVKRMVA